MNGWDGEEIQDEFAYENDQDIFEDEYICPRCEADLDEPGKPCYYCGYDPLYQE